MKDPQPLFANPEVFFSTLIAHFAEPLAHYGKLVHDTLTLLENAHGGLVAGEPFRESGKKSIPVTALLQSKVLKSSRAAENRIVVASSGGLSRIDGRWYSKWAILCKSSDYFGEPHRSVSSPLCRLELNVSLSLVKKMGSARYIQLVNEVFALCASHTPECMYGFVDIMSAAESSGGRCYSDAAAGGDWCGWHRLLEQYDWAYQEERRYESVQGVYWGNYLGPRILAKFNGAEAIMESFRNFRPYPGRYDHVATAHGNGCLLLTSSTPMELAEPGFAYASYETRVATWLRQEFRRASVL